MIRPKYCRGKTKCCNWTVSMTKIPKTVTLGTTRKGPPAPVRAGQTAPAPGGSRPPNVGQPPSFFGFDMMKRGHVRSYCNPLSITDTLGAWNQLPNYLKMTQLTSAFRHGLKIFPSRVQLQTSCAARWPPQYAPPRDLDF